MKKAGLLLLAAGLAAGSLAYASEGYVGVHRPLSTFSKKSANLYPPTDITVINVASNAIRVKVPYSSVNDVLYPQSIPYHITHTGGSFVTTLDIKDMSYRNVFYGSVCPQALVTVYGYAGNNTYYVDEEYCH